MAPKNNKRKSSSLRSIAKRWSTGGINANTVEQHLSDLTADEDFIPAASELIDFNSEHILNDVGDLFTLCSQEGNRKYLSTKIYMLLRHLNKPWREIDQILASIGATSCETSHNWSKLFVHGDFQDFTNENRGGKRSDSFWDMFPDLEVEARAFVVQECSERGSAFTVNDLGNLLINATKRSAGIRLPEVH